jgi:hypothetical protein
MTSHRDNVLQGPKSPRVHSIPTPFLLGPAHLSTLSMIEITVAPEPRREGEPVDGEEEDDLDEEVSMCYHFFEHMRFIVAGG